ncbi:hypothetical protein [Dactylococcopsis salina]|uniref:Uncharacterized protein n=1 Tax=Dactylococcopsis salina (strain PCC 8305) TaxID=13035 RepID=K9YU65_DACS8|nr:hypothetical protein [Dactylococcopsis salina]AFZ50047.1 hypothetical protein Dacsa_1353 [Dactylococcopsis salina PCC 8305]
MERLHPWNVSTHGTSPPMECLHAKPNTNQDKGQPCRLGGVYETQHQLVIGHWSLVISH